MSAADNLAGLTLREVAEELRALVALAETCERPRPTRIIDEGEWAGREWTIKYRQYDQYDPQRLWQVRARDEDEVANVVYVHTPDSMPGDMVSVPTTEARWLAMAILAACDRAEHLSAGVSFLEDRRAGRA